jgi:hypothetical protein
MKKMEDKKFDDYTKEEQEEIKEVVIERIKQIPDELRLCVG